MTIYEEIAAERARQVAKGYTAEHDDRHTEGELAELAGLMIMARMYDEHASLEGVDRAIEMLDKCNHRRSLIIGLALGVAELERLDRAKEKA